MELNKVYNLDFLDNTLPDKSVQLIIADPPYFEVKGAFDFVWPSFDAYLSDVERWAKECKRVLADNGTLFWYGDAKKIAYSQTIIDRYFKLENNIVWENTNPHKQQIRFSEGLRSFAPLTERVLMYSNEIKRTGLEEIKLDINNFQTLRQYFKELQLWIGIGLKAINEKLGHRKAARGFYHSSTQWGLPTESTYNQLIEHFKISEWSGFKEYEALREEYEALRRPFNNAAHHGDVLRFPNYNTKTHDHDTVKPETLTRVLIQTCSRPNDIVLAPFAGSGTECAMAIKEGRRCIGFDIEPKYVEMANKRIEKHRSQPTIF